MNNMVDAKMKTDVVGKIIDFETGAMETKEEVIEFFQELIDTGLAWTLQGSYGRMAKTLIEEGYCHQKGEGGD